MDGDGVDDVLIGAKGASAAYLALGPLSGKHSLEDVQARLYDAGGYAVDLAGDVDGDGRADLVIADPGRYTAWLHYGLPEGEVDLDELADATLLAETEPQTVAMAGDVDGDGMDDVLVGGGPGAEAFLVIGPRLGTVSLNSETIRLEPEDPESSLLRVSHGIGDLDLDGLDDLVVLDFPLSGEGGGAAYVFTQGWEQL